MRAIDDHETGLREVIEGGLAQFEQITVHSGAAERTPYNSREDADRLLNCVADFFSDA
jgi:hypothetical protein